MDDYKPTPMWVMIIIQVISIIIGMKIGDIIVGWIELA